MPALTSRAAVRSGDGARRARPWRSCHRRADRPPRARARRLGAPGGRARRRARRTWRAERRRAAARYRACPRTGTSRRPTTNGGCSRSRRSSWRRESSPPASSTGGSARDFPRGPVGAGVRAGARWASPHAGISEGRLGRVERVHAAFRSPETRAYGAKGFRAGPVPRRLRAGRPLAGLRRRPRDRVYADVFEHWLEAVEVMHDDRPLARADHERRQACRRGASAGARGAARREGSRRP